MRWKKQTWKDRLREELRRDSLSRNERAMLVLPMALAVFAQGGMQLLSQEVWRGFEAEPVYQVMLDRPLEKELQAAPLPSKEQLDVMFSAYSHYYQVSEGLLRSIAFCESRYNPKATNGKYAGLYQFDERTWVATRKRMQVETDPAWRFDAEQAIKTAAYKMANEGTGAWVVCSKKYWARS